jgi:hypothetical protein
VETDGVIAGRRITFGEVHHSLFDIRKRSAVESRLFGSLVGEEILALLDWYFMWSFDSCFDTNCGSPGQSPDKSDYRTLSVNNIMFVIRMLTKVVITGDIAG